LYRRNDIHSSLNISLTEGAGHLHDRLMIWEAKQVAKATLIEENSKPYNTNRNED
jgi:hypothetical protein